MGHTYRSRLDCVAICSGSGPVNLFRSMKMVPIRLFSRILSGKGLSSKLLLATRVWNFLRFPISVGMVPQRRLFGTKRDSRSCRYWSSEGMVPIRWLPMVVPNDQAERIGKGSQRKYNALNKWCG